MCVVACGAPRTRDGDVTTIALVAADGGDAQTATSTVGDASPEPVADAAPFVRGACGLDDGQSVAFGRWRASIEGYSPAVRPGNQVALGGAIRPFALYLSQMHRRIHPYFAERFLTSFAPASPPDLVVRLEIVLAPTGAIARLGVVKSSGVTAFDIGALESVACASPYAEPDPVMRSPDGNVYVWWELHSDPVLSCSTINVRPFLLQR
jgi:hypothetical protein